MSKKKRSVRDSFRNSVFERDQYQCRMCGWKPLHGHEGLDAHHITDRNLLPNGGYVRENGITLCQELCHPRAEEYHSTGLSYPGYSPEELYAVIGSNKDVALKSSLKLK